MPRKYQYLMCINILICIFLIYTTYTDMPISRNTVRKCKQTGLDEHYDSREPLPFEIVIEMQKKLHNLPLEYYNRHKDKMMQRFKNCAHYPAIQNLNFYNTYWQTFYVDNSIYQLYGAYYDDRPKSGPVIRILAMSNRPMKYVSTIYCQLWFEDDNRPFLGKVKENKIIWNRSWGINRDAYYPYLLTCEIPNNINITGDPSPKVVNLVRYQCDTARNSLRIVYEKPKLKEKKRFAVCVKGLDFPYEDISTRLVEWLELLKLLGVDNVYMYHLQTHKNIQKVLKYYQSKGFVDVQETTLVGGVVGQPKLAHWLIKTYPFNKSLNELIPYNDCFYRNMYKYDYVALLDVNEIIMPKGGLKTWHDLLAKAHSVQFRYNCNLGYTSLCATSVYFPKNIPNQQLLLDIQIPNMYMLNHAHRIEDYSPTHNYVKCIHNTKHILTLHNHYPLSHMNTNCPPSNLSTIYVQLQNYLTEETSESLGWDHRITRDGTLDQFRTQLTERCSKVLKNLQLT